MHYLPWPLFHYCIGPVHEVEVRGFVDVRLDDVGEWGEEDPGAFMGKDGIEQLMLRTCTAGNVTLSWNSDKIGLYTDPACEEQHKVDEDEGSVEGSRRATFTPDGTYTDNWETLFRTKTLWAKGAAPSAVGGDIQLALSPVTGEAPPDLVNLAVFEVVIDTPADTPGADPAFVCKWGKLQLGCTVRPWEARGGTYEWSKVTGPGTVTFTPAEIVGNPEFSANDVGMYAVKVEYTLSGGTCRDTKEIVVWRMVYVEDDSTTCTIEGYPAGGGRITGLLGEYGSMGVSGDTSGVKSISLGFSMHSEGRRFDDDYGAGSCLVVCGETRWDVYLDVGDATAAVRVSAAWQGSGDADPESPLMNRGSLSICHLYPDSASYMVVINAAGHREVIHNEDEVGNPLTWSGVAHGTQPLGFVQAGVDYIDSGADPGSAFGYMHVGYSVTHE